MGTNSPVSLFHGRKHFIWCLGPLFSLSVPLGCSFPPQLCVKAIENTCNQSYDCRKQHASYATQTNTAGCNRGLELVPTEFHCLQLMQEQALTSYGARLERTQKYFANCAPKSALNQFYTVKLWCIYIAEDRTGCCTIVLFLETSSIL